jgi:hypothetical protein
MKKSSEKSSIRNTGEEREIIVTRVIRSHIAQYRILFMRAVFWKPIISGHSPLYKWTQPPVQVDTAPSTSGNSPLYKWTQPPVQAETAPSTSGHSPLYMWTQLINKHSVINSFIRQTQARYELITAGLMGMQVTYDVTLCHWVTGPHEADMMLWINPNQQHSVTSLPTDVLSILLMKLTARDSHLSWTPILMAVKHNKTTWLEYQLAFFFCYCTDNFQLSQPLSINKSGWLISCCVEWDSLLRSLNISYYSRKIFIILKLNFHAFNVSEVTLLLYFMSSHNQISVLYWKIILVFVVASLLSINHRHWDFTVFLSSPPAGNEFYNEWSSTPITPCASITWQVPYEQVYINPSIQFQMITCNKVEIMGTKKHFWEFG